ncbi:MAG: amino acid ABC transporter permease [Clostridiales bacterium]|nr:amino acid ABC transporter permease [Clostridiales bacterium]
MGDLLTGTNISFLLNGLKITITIAVATTFISILCGTILGVIKTYYRGILSKIASIYIEIFRNTPLILWILVCRFMIPIKPLYSGILSMSLFTTAVMAEIIRGGLNSVNQGQYEAGISQGFRKTQVLRYIILPQAFKNMVPAMLSQVISTIKDTSFLWIVGIEEFTGKGMILMGSFATSAQVFELFALIALTYFVVNFILAFIVKKSQGNRSLA